MSEVFVEVKDVASKEETVEEIGVRVAKTRMSKRLKNGYGQVKGVTYMRLN